MVYFIIFIILALIAAFLITYHFSDTKKKEHADLMQKVMKWQEGQDRIEAAVNKILKVLKTDNNEASDGKEKTDKKMR